MKTTVFAGTFTVGVVGRVSVRNIEPLVLGSQLHEFLDKFVCGFEKFESRHLTRIKLFTRKWVTCREFFKQHFLALFESRQSGIHGLFSFFGRGWKKLGNSRLGDGTVKRFDLSCPRLGLFDVPVVLWKTPAHRIDRGKEMFSTLCVSRLILGSVGNLHGGFPQLICEVSTLLGRANIGTKSKSHDVIMSALLPAVRFKHCVHRHPSSADRQKPCNQCFPLRYLKTCIDLHGNSKADDPAEKISGYLISQYLFPLPLKLKPNNRFWLHADGWL